MRGREIKGEKTKESEIKAKGNAREIERKINKWSYKLNKY